MPGQETADGVLPGRRRALLTAYVDDHGQATVTELADTFGVSADTVRRDLDWLAKHGAVSRTYGGAVAVAGLATADSSFSDRSSVHREEKQRIAAAAAQRIADGETVIINGGTTTLAVAAALRVRRDLTIVTNNLRVPPALPAGSVRDVYLLGGSCRLTSHVTIGPVAFPGTEGISADVAVIGVGGVSASAGLTTTNLSEAQMMAQMIESAQRTMVVVDSAKFGRNCFAHIVRLEVVDMLVTDRQPDDALTEALSSAGVEMVVAGETTVRSLSGMKIGFGGDQHALQGQRMLARCQAERGRVKRIADRAVAGRGEGGDRRPVDGQLDRVTGQEACAGYRGRAAGRDVAG
ncbi:MAG: DeoR/GlpR transcriptional regulator [Streptosporangiaceae bacterium]|nr:DeoR/GlpR transcriptional regulator [Streptosporangiaceae bacterium]